MSEEDLVRRIRGVGALSEPVRRALYLFVAGHTEPVSRDVAAAGVGIARHLAKFHLDRLVEEGLLEAHFQRLTGRSGPGAGRPAKLYRRAAGELAVSLPDREYRLAGELMAAAIDASVTRGVPVMDALTDAAARRGREVAARAGAAACADDEGPADVTGVATSTDVAARAAAAGDDEEPAATGTGAATPTDADHTPDRAGSLLDRVCAVLAEEGYEPAVRDDEVVLRNCPFHALAAQHTALVCGMNLALLGSFGDALSSGAGAAPDGDAGAVTARLDPAPGRCCVVLSVR